MLPIKCLSITLCQVTNIYVTKVAKVKHKLLIRYKLEI